MRILVIDNFFERRDPAMRDMYSLIGKKHTLLFDYVVSPEREDYDFLWLGIYHRSLDIDFKQLFSHNTKPIIIDQADNEETIQRMELYSGLTNVTVLSRYLPNKPLESKCAEMGFTLKLLPWYVNPQRVPENFKTCDVAFICSQYGEREKIASLLRYIERKTDYTATIGEYWGKEYLNRLSRCRISIVECGRFCLTQKYIESSLANCVLIGDVPKYPENRLSVIDTFLFDVVELRNTIKEALTLQRESARNKGYILDTFANEGWFYNHLNSIL